MIKIELVTLSGVKLSETVYEVLLPTMEGQIGVLPGHMALVSVATPGVIFVRKEATTRDDMMEAYATNGGVIEIENDTLRVLVDEADHAEEISEAEAQKALDLAIKMKTEAKDQVSLEKAQTLIDRQAVRLQVAGLRRRNRR